MADFKNYLETFLSDREEKSLLSQTFSDGTLKEVQHGIIEYIPNQITKVAPLILSCGIHGNETAPIEMISDLLSEISQGALNPHRPTLFLFGHKEAMKAHKRFIEYNLNRLFGGIYKTRSESIEAPLAQALENAVYEFYKRFGVGIHLDLHTAMRGSKIQKFAIGPLNKGESFSKEQTSLLETLGIQAVVHSDNSGTTFSSFSKRELGHHAYTLELGKVMPFGKNKRSDFLDTYEGLRDLLLNSPFQSRCELQRFEVAKELLRDSENYEFYISADYINFDFFEEGTPIEKNKEGVLNAESGQCLIFPNPDVPIGQRTGLLLKAIGTL